MLNSVPAQVRITPRTRTCGHLQKAMSVTRASVDVVSEPPSKRVAPAQCQRRRGKSEKAELTDVKDLVVVEQLLLAAVLEVKALVDEAGAVDPFCATPTHFLDQRAVELQGPVSLDNIAGRQQRTSSSILRIVLAFVRHDAKTSGSSLKSGKTSTGGVAPISLISEQGSCDASAPVQQPPTQHRP